jgi:hypothetical protein
LRRGLRCLDLNGVVFLLCGSKLREGSHAEG